MLSGVCTHQCLCCNGIEGLGKQGNHRVMYSLCVCVCVVTSLSMHARSIIVWLTSAEGIIQSETERE